MFKTIVLSALLEIALGSFSFATAQGTTSRPPITNVPYGDCKGKPDGAFLPHPWDCTRYIRCTHGEIAHDMPCPTCVPDPVRCPAGFLHWDQALLTCNWVDQAGCNGTTPTTPVTTPTTAVTTPTTAVTTPTTTISTTTPVMPSPGNCDPNNCTIVGICLTYTYCNRTDLEEVGPIGGSGNLVTEKCGKLGTTQLYFNPDTSSCDLWRNLSPATKGQYLKEDECRVCVYKAKSSCSAEYTYEHEVESPPGSGNFNWVVDDRICSAGLVFDETLLTCADPCLVKLKDGRECKSILSLSC